MVDGVWFRCHTHNVCEKHELECCDSNSNGYTRTND